MKAPDGQAAHDDRPTNLNGAGDAGEQRPEAPAGDTTAPGADHGADEAEGEQRRDGDDQQPCSEHQPRSNHQLGQRKNSCGDRYEPARRPRLTEEQSAEREPRAVEVEQLRASGNGEDQRDGQFRSATETRGDVHRESVYVTVGRRTHRGR